ncbi:MAG: hypothetical protein ETSY1_12620 [Candidatus Entotheonella factor]|uniref:Uncharacterized protein n=1 Tax=Entotheonella factor TaxID=1429438 RepID=W4LPN4_ENTF1|nr:GTPase domain-containing protein [Candidatus Entotheonella palauensis]ETX00039.1 MAG: hypothetical protein ETSY1_12620 [Candidatus Entotheonella factor]
MLDFLVTFSAIVTGGALVALLFNFFIPRMKNPFALAYNVAVIGFPKSGKTVMITSIFGQLFSDRYLGRGVILRGKDTIERVNKDLELLEIGRLLGPTTDQDIFAYRADIRRGIFPLQREYKVVIGDFPGESSEEFVEDSVEWLHESSYFKWVMEADAFIFVIDIARILTDNDNREYRAMITRAIRAAWQHIYEFHVEGKKNLNRKPLMLVFTKADLLLKYTHKIDVVSTNKGSSTVANNLINEEIMNFGFSQLPEIVRVEQREIQDEIKIVEELYREIIAYLHLQTSNFGCFFVSHFVMDENGRLGIPALTEKLLPK